MIASRPTVIVVGGPAGTGKTTQGELLSSYYKCPFIEGDSLHPKANIDKMSAGIPLTDDDRWGWLEEVSKTSSTSAVDPGNASHIAVVSCSMLKKSYRDYIKEKSSGDEVVFRFVFIYTTFEELMKRVGNRKGHYMKSDMVRSQYDIMEIPKGKELTSNGGDCIALDATDKSPEVIFKEIVGYEELI
ncbi:putative gluconokinase [Candida viswanathii]|uniref:Gluconokinase n=1 Tax=Candida viswanathii TaxID=5486 RepID=A0A367XN96_9ASCO|nr:putative gluconokinase [Candida viswanathii]